MVILVMFSEGSHDVILLMDPVLILVHSQLPVGVEHPGAVLAVVEEGTVLVLAFNVVQHIAL